MNYTITKYRNRLRLSILQRLYDSPLFINRFNYEMALSAIGVWEKHGIHALINYHADMSECLDPIYTREYLTEQQHIEEFAKCVNSYDIGLTRFIISFLLAVFADEDNTNFVLLSDLIKEFSHHEPDYQYELLMRVTEVGGQREELDFTVNRPNRSARRSAKRSAKRSKLVN